MEELINQIIDNSNDSIDQKIQACNKLSKIVKNMDAANAEKLLPPLIKLMSSNDGRLKKSVIFLLTAIITVNTNIIFSSDVISNLIQLLSTSEDQNVSKDCLNCIIIISNYYPVEVAKSNALPQLIQFIKGNNSQTAYKAVCILKNISQDNQNIDAIIKAESIQFLVNILSSKNIDSIKEAIEILTNVASYSYHSCKIVLGYGTLHLINTNLNHPALKMVALNFIDKILYTEDEIDKIIDEQVILSILKQLSSRDSAEIKLKSIVIIKIIAEKKPGYCYTLINNDIISLFAEQLDNENIELLITVLSTLKMVVDATAYFQPNQILDEKLQKLNGHENEIKNLSTNILNSIMENNLQHQATVKNIKSEMKTEEIDNDQSNQIHMHLENTRSDENSETLAAETFIDANEQERELVDSNVQNSEQLINRGSPLQLPASPQPTIPPEHFSNEQSITAGMVSSSANEPSKDKDTTTLSKKMADKLFIKEIEFFEMNKLINGSIPDQKKACNLFKKKFFQTNRCLDTEVKQCQTNTSLIFETDGAVLGLINCLKTSKRKITEEILKVLIEAASDGAQRCKILLEKGVFKYFKDMVNVSTGIKLLTIKFVEVVVKFDEREMDVFVEEIIPYLLVMMKTKVVKIKIRSMEILKQLIKNKPKFAQSFIQNRGIYYICSNLSSQNVTLLSIILNTLEEIIQLTGFKCLQTRFKRFGGLKKLRKLLENKNEEVKILATTVFNDCIWDDSSDNDVIPLIFDGSVPPDPIETVTVDGHEIQNGQSRKRPMNDKDVEQFHTKSKQAKTEQTDDGAVTDDNDHEFENITYASLFQSNIPQDDDIFGNNLDRQSRISFSSDNEKSYPIPPSPRMLLTLPEDEPTPIPESGDPRYQNAFETFEYICPSEKNIKSFCEMFGLTYNRQKYSLFCSKIDFSEISANSVPVDVIRTSETTGFECLSVLFTGEEKYAEKIREGTRMKFIKNSAAAKEWDAEKLAQICCTVLNETHLHTITSWCSCKFMVWFNDEWQLFGNWESGDDPVFVLKKEIVEDQVVYKVVKSLEEDF